MNNPMPILDRIEVLILQGEKEQAIALLHEIKQTTHNHQRLGCENQVVTTDPLKLPGSVTDELRHAIISYCTNRDTTASGIRGLSLLCESDFMKVMPGWFKAFAGHVPKEMFAILLMQVAMSLDELGESVGGLPLPYPIEEHRTREELLWSGAISQIDQPLPSPTPA